MVFPVADKSSQSGWGAPEALLSDKGTNLLSHLILNVCVLLELKNLTQQLITLSAMLHKQAVTHGAQWDKCLPGVLWAYRNTLTTPQGKSHLFFVPSPQLR